VTTDFYVDGQSVGSSARKVMTDVVSVGNYKNSGYWFSRTLDDVRIYGGALTAMEVAMLARQGADAYGIPDAWKIQYFGSTNGPNTGALEDWDHDGMNNLGEYGAGTCPTNRRSLLKISGLQPGAGSDWVLGWLSVSGKTYTIRGTTNLLLGFPEAVSNGIPGTGSTNTCVLPMGQGPRKFYRVVVE
jgi:hypothetical protein